MVHGRVQGVGFRFFVQRRAERLPITGTVRNLSTHGVEVQARGPLPALEEFVEILREGPQLARVTDVDVQWGVPLANFTDFRISY